MRRLLLLSLLLGAVAACSRPDAPDFAEQIAAHDEISGFFNMYWDENEGRLILRIDRFEEPFLYQSSLARGIGSNDIGLDRGQLGDTRIVEFQRSGPKVLMVQHNLGYRAVSDNPEEQQAVDESFARSVIWGFTSLGELNGAHYVDATDFLLRDSHGISAWLSELEEGSYQADAARSAVYLPMTRGFPDNAEIEAVVTYTGQPSGKWLPTVVPDATAITVHLHHSLIRLPDDQYEPLPYDPRVGLIGVSYGTDGYVDYARPVGDAVTVDYARRHRLQKKDPAADVSEAAQPIVYYLDRGVPEPVRSALLDGASWWNQAFEAAGYRDAFQVKVLPEGVDPMDVRYNVIQWVHRATRGWSYGSSIVDPRSGEILKGHVTLGSQRVRQDYLIAEGLLAPYRDETVPPEMLQMSLARIRQLAAHEVGHTLGIEHNFAASTQDRSSVMDYPFPLIRFDDNGNVDLSDAYGSGIGAWDVSVIKYGYQDYAEGEDAEEERDKIIAETIASGLRFVADSDSRAVGSAHPDGNLWDNGTDALAELEHLLRVRAYALGRFSERNIRPGRPLATLEEALVPIYLLHRYQLQAAGKLIGGQYFSYALRGDGQDVTELVSAARQRAAMAALLGTLDPVALRLPDKLLNALPARPPGHRKSREAFPTATGPTFDPLGPARSAVSLTLDVLLEPGRAARLVAANARQGELPGFDELTAALMDATWFSARQPGIDGAIQRGSNDLVLQRLMQLSVAGNANADVRAIALDSVSGLDDWLSGRATGESDAVWRAHYTQARQQIRRMLDDPRGLGELSPVAAPPGDPIGDYPLSW